MNERVAAELRSHDVLFSCEGKCEAVIMKRLLENDRLVLSADEVVHDDEHGTPYTLLRKAPDIERTFMGVEYDKGPLLIARIVDSDPGSFVLSRARRNDAIVRDFVTSPEIEALTLIKEGRYDDWRRRHHGKGRQLNASNYCVQVLGMSQVKQYRFLLDYWSDVNELVACILTYQSKQGKRKDRTLGLADLLR